MKYLDRLVAVEPIWQNYDWRAENRFRHNRWEDAAEDYLEAERLAGKGYWHHRFPWPGLSVSTLVDNLILTANETGRPEMSRLGLRLAEKLNAATPDNRDRRIRLAIAHYRLSNYDKALSLLELWQREREREIIGQVGQFFMGPFPVPYLEKTIVSKDAVEATAFLAMTHHRLGHHDRARHALAELRRIGDSFSGTMKNPFAPFGSREPIRWKQYLSYQNLRREAETLIEGKPRPDK